MYFRNESAVYRIVMNELMVVMIATFFMPWVRMTIGYENRYYRYIGGLTSRYSSPSEKIVYYVVNHSNNIALNVMNLIVFVFVTLFLFETIQERKVIALIIGIVVPFIVILPNVFEVMSQYAPYYNEMHPNAEYPVECHLGWGFYVYIVSFGLSVLLGLINCFRKEGLMSDDNFNLIIRK